MRKDRELFTPRCKGRPNRMTRAKELGATHFLDVRDKFSGDEYPVFVYPGQKLADFKKQFSKVTFTITKVE